MTAAAPLPGRSPKTAAAPRRPAGGVHAALQKHALSLPGATQDIKWGCDWVASVGGKMFLVGGPEPGPWEGCSFKVDEHRFLELSGLPGWRRRPTWRA